MSNRKLGGASPLSRLQAALLFALWKRRRSGDGHLSTANELGEQLIKGHFGKGFADLKVKDLKKPLRKLEEAGLVETGPAWKNDESRPGPQPRGYRLPESPNLISWQSTARLLLELFNDPHRPVDEERFVSGITQLGLSKDDTGSQLTRDDILAQIEYCVRKGFLQADAEANIASGLGRRIRCTAKVDEHLSFLEMIAAPKQPPVGEAQTSSN